MRVKADGPWWNCYRPLQEEPAKQEPALKKKKKAKRYIYKKGRTTETGPK